MRGTEILQNLKNIIGFNTPVVALTADIIPGMEEKYVSKGFDGCLSKPIIKEQLHEILKKILLKDSEKTIPQQHEKQLEQKVVLKPKILIEYGVDVESSLEKLDEESYNKEISLFYNILEDKMNRLYEYKNAHDLENYYIAVKSLKEIASSLGFTKFANVAEKHEQASRESKQDYLDRDYPKLKMESIRINDILKEYFGK
jgi:HPt (histidine-containing phosphotransfer) domain-containing protein